jgi:DNA mismatch endonuclease (patch repair protein)
MALVSPPASSANARATMRANKGKNTKPELIVRKMLRDAGHPGYRLHWKIRDKAGRVICKPDICYPGKKIAIFVHGCFWHRCPTRNPPMPKKNRDYWLAKFEDNVARDRLKEQLLRMNGWSVRTIWECSFGRL